MNKVLLLIKSSLKQLLASLPIMLLIYVVLPTSLVFFTGGAFEKNAGAEIEKVKIMVEDEDKTVSSESLITFLKSEEISKYIEIKDDQNSEVIKVPKGYEQALKNEKEFKIKLTSMKHSSTMVENLLNQYHKGISLLQKGLTQEEVDVIINGGIVKDSTKMEMKNSQGMGVLAAGFISTIIIMALNGYMSQRCLDQTKNLIIRENSTPNSKIQLLLYSVMMNGIIVISMIAIYIAIFRFTGNGFTGDLGIIVLMSIVSALFGFVFAIFITVLTPPKLGMVIGTAVMLITMISSFNTPILGGLIGDINPLKTINEMFVAYEIHGTFDVIKTNLLHLISAIGIMGVAIMIRIKGKKVIN